MLDYNFNITLNVYDTLKVADVFPIFLKVTTSCNNDSWIKVGYLGYTTDLILVAMLSYIVFHFKRSDSSRAQIVEQR